MPSRLLCPRRFLATRYGGRKVFHGEPVKKLKAFSQRNLKKVCWKVKKMLDRTSYYAIYCWIASLSPIWDRSRPHTGDKFLRRIQPWRELFSPRSVSARKFMAFWPAWAPRTAARSSMLVVQRAARAWLSDLCLAGEIRRRNEYAHKRPLISHWRSYFFTRQKFFRKNARMGF